MHFKSITILQSVRFHDFIDRPCCKYTYNVAPRSIHYEATLLNTTGMSPKVIAMQGRFKSIAFQLEPREKINLNLQWCAVGEKSEHWHTAPNSAHLYPNHSGYVKHLFSSESPLKLHLIQYLEDNYHDVLHFCAPKIPQPLPECAIRKITHKPKLFSRNTAHTLCKLANRSLPEFISRKQQEQFISFVKNSYKIFPVGALFISLLQCRNILDLVRKNQLFLVLKAFAVCSFHLCCCS